jgi:glycosyltransferase involved in cell wall biosynthesis
MCAKEAKGRPFYALVSPDWYVTERLCELRVKAQRAKEKLPEATIIFLVPTKSELELLQDNGLTALWVHVGAFVDETIFYPDFEATKKFSAVHNATCDFYKRHELAWGVERIAVISSLHDQDNLTRRLELIKGYQDLAYCNLSPNGEVHWIDEKGVRAIICQSHCGLILSEVEGFCRASAEYLFCGIPVVTTPSKGGRDELFDSSCVYTVSPNRFAIEQAVKTIRKDGYDPAQIRAGVVRKSREHRLRLINWLSDVSKRDVYAEANESGWIPSFSHLLQKWQFIDDRDIIFRES